MADNIRKDQKQDYNLDWKSHDMFFTSLNQKLDEITLVGEQCYGNLDKIYEYFSKIKNLYNKHKAYFQKPEELITKLSKIEEVLFDENFIKDVKDKRDQATMTRYKIFVRLQTIFAQMAEDFTIPELIPKPIKKEREPWQDEKDYKKKQLYKTTMLMYENL